MSTTDTNSWTSVSGPAGTRSSHGPMLMGSRCRRRTHESEQQNQADAAEFARNLSGQMKDGGDKLGLHDQRAGRYKQDARHERQCREQRDLGDIGGIQARGEVDAVADRTAGEQAESKGVGDRVTAERGKPHGRQGQAPADVAQRAPVITGECEKAAACEAECQQQLCRSQCLKLGEKLAVSDFGEQTMNGEDAKEKDKERRRRKKPQTRLTVIGSKPARLVAHRAPAIRKMRRANGTDNLM
ncbi:MAG: hypothetical protein ACT4NU_09005 [Chromatiales bacterium]